jgi:hypothetical protein
MDLDERERNLISVSLAGYRHAIREACVKDQGIPQGKPGTIGHNMQIELRELEERVRNNRDDAAAENPYRNTAGFNSGA